MTATSLLDVERVGVLGEKSFRGLRLDVTAGAADARDLVRGRFSPRDLRVAVGNPGRPKDLVGTYWAGIKAMSRRMVEFLEAERLTGWRAIPLPIPESGDVPPLWLLTVTGTAGHPYGSGGLRVRGLPRLGTFIDPRRWDGSDFFLLGGSATYVAPNAVETFRRSRLTNLAVEPAGLEPLPEHLRFPSNVVREQA